MNTVLSKYGSVIASTVITLLAALQTTQYNLASILQLVVLALTAFVVWWVPLLKGGWVGGLKTGVELLGTLIVAFIPFALQGDWSGPQIIVILIALVKAGATQLGVIIRTEPLLEAKGSGTKADPAVITTLVADKPAAEVQAARHLAVTQ